MIPSQSPQSRSGAEPVIPVLEPQVEVHKDLDLQGEVGVVFELTDAVSVVEKPSDDVPANLKSVDAVDGVMEPPEGGKIAARHRRPDV